MKYNKAKSIAKIGQYNFLLKIIKLDNGAPLTNDEIYALALTAV